MTSSIIRACQRAITCPKWRDFLLAWLGFSITAALSSPLFGQNASGFDNPQAGIYQQNNTQVPPTPPAPSSPTPAKGATRRYSPPAINSPSNSDNFSRQQAPPPSPAQQAQANLPSIGLEEAPLQAPPALAASSGGTMRSSLLHRQSVIEAEVGYLGFELNSYNVNTDGGNSKGNDQETAWRSFYNLSTSLSFSGQLKSFYYKAWFMMPFSLSQDNIIETRFEYSLAGRDKIADNPSYFAELQGKQNYIIAGGLRAGFDLLKRHSATLVFGLGLDGLSAEWDIDKGSYNSFVSAGIFFESDGVINQQYIKFWAGQLMPLVFIHSNFFLSPIVEFNLELGYSPMSMWLSYDTRFDNLIQNRRYGYFGQTLNGSFELRFWLGRRFALKLGARGQYTFRTVGTTRIYDVDDTGTLTDPTLYTLLLNTGGFELKFFQGYLGFGLSFDKKLPPGKQYQMNF